MNSSPSANFNGLEGWRSPIRIQRVENNGVNMITKAGVSDCRYTGENPIPKISLRVSLSANRLRLDPFCSYAAQKRIVKMKRMTIATMRNQSLLVEGAAGATSA